MASPRSAIGGDAVDKTTSGGANKAGGQGAIEEDCNLLDGISLEIQSLTSSLVSLSEENGKYKELFNYCQLN